MLPFCDCNLPGCELCRRFRWGRRKRRPKAQRRGSSIDKHEVISPWANLKAVGETKCVRYPIPRCD